MNKTELISAVAKKTGLSKSEVAKVLNTSLDVISTELSEGQEVQLVGFGKFSISCVKAHYGRNPLNINEVIKIDEMNRVYFSAGAKLKRRINEK